MDDGQDCCCCGTAEWAATHTPPSPLSLAPVASAESATETEAEETEAEAEAAGEAAVVGASAATTVEEAESPSGDFCEFRRPHLVLQLETDEDTAAVMDELCSFERQGAEGRRGDNEDSAENPRDRDDVLVSPAISPVPWAKEVPSAVAKRRSAINQAESTVALQVNSGRQCVTLQVPSVRLPIKRHGSSASLTSDNDEEPETEPSKENLHRRGRRAAIYNSKNLTGEAKSPDRSPNESGNEDNGEEPKRRRSSLELNVEVLPRVDMLKEKSKKILKKQNTIADLTQKTLQSFSPNDETSKRRGMSFLKLIEKKRSKGRDSLADLQEVLSSLKSSEFRDTYLMSFKNTHWRDLFERESASTAARPSSSMSSTSSSSTTAASVATAAAAQSAELEDTERLRREAVWELFKSELNFLIDYLMVLKHCFFEPLKKLQVDGHLMFVEPEDLFGNIDELCYVSYTFSRDLISILTKEARKRQFGTTTGLLKAFKRWVLTSKDGEVFHSYCLNYHCAVTYLEILRRHEQFTEFERWCEQDLRCHRLKLADLLVAPMQHCTKMPLLLASIRRYTAEDSSRALLTENLKRVENSLKSLEDKLKWLRNFERLQTIQQQLIWPPITELETRVFIPEFLKSSLSSQPCEKLIANPKRQLVHEGFLSLVETNRSLEIYCFLFDDILLLTKVKKPPKKRSVAESSAYSVSPTEGALLVVHRQPIALDRFSIHDIGFVEANANGLKHAFVLIHISRFQQIIGVYTLQTATDQQKVTWIDHLRQSQQRFQEKLKFRLAMSGASSAGGASGGGACGSDSSGAVGRGASSSVISARATKSSAGASGGSRAEPPSGPPRPASRQQSRLISRMQRLHQRRRGDGGEDTEDEDSESDDSADCSDEPVAAPQSAAPSCSTCGGLSVGGTAASRRQSSAVVGAAAVGRQPLVRGATIASSNASASAVSPSAPPPVPPRRRPRKPTELMPGGASGRDLGYIVKITGPFSPPLSPTLHSMDTSELHSKPPPSLLLPQSQQQPQQQQLKLPNKFLDIKGAGGAGAAGGSTGSSKQHLSLAIDLRPRSSSDVREVDLSPDSDSPVDHHQERSASVDVIGTDMNAGRQLSIIDEDQLDFPSLAPPMESRGAAGSGGRSGGRGGGGSGRDRLWRI